jgi:hypothetical protein
MPPLERPRGPALQLIAFSPRKIQSATHPAFGGTLKDETPGVPASRRPGVPASRRPGVDKLLPGRKFLSATRPGRLPRCPMSRPAIELPARAPSFNDRASQRNRRVIVPQWRLPDCSGSLITCGECHQLTKRVGVAWSLVKRREYMDPIDQTSAATYRIGAFVRGPQATQRRRHQLGAGRPSGCEGLPSNRGNGTAKTSTRDRPPERLRGVAIELRQRNG